MFFFYEIGELEGRTCIHMYVKAKVILVETVPGIRGGVMGERSVGA
jgi:hypothetical protein